MVKLNALVKSFHLVSQHITPLLPLAQPCSANSDGYSAIYYFIAIIVGALVLIVI